MVHVFRQVYKVKDILPRIPDVPNESITKLKEFFTWKKRNLITKEELDNTTEKLKQEIMTSVDAVLKEYEIKTENIKAEMLREIEKLNEKEKSEFELVHDEIKRRNDKTANTLTSLIND